MHTYYPILKASQAEKETLNNLSARAKSKIFPILQWVPGRAKNWIEIILEENRDVQFWVEYPETAINEEIRTCEARIKMFGHLRNQHSNFYPVISVNQSDDIRTIVRSVFHLSETFERVAIKGSLTSNLRGKTLNVSLSLYSSFPELDKILFIFDFGHVKPENVEEVINDISRILRMFPEANVVISMTPFWGSLSETPGFERGEVVEIDNLPYLLWNSEFQGRYIYSDYVTEHSEPTIVSFQNKYPYLKYLTLDGSRFKIFQSEYGGQNYSGYVAEQLLNIRNLIHPDDCWGCKFLNDLIDRQTTNATKRKVASFVHHIEVITSLLQ